MEQFLPSVRTTKYEQLSIIIADNGSTDDSLHYLKTIGATEFEPDNRQMQAFCYLPLPENYGFAEGYNRALAQVQHADYYVLLNSDVEVTPDWITPVINLMESDKNIGVCQPKILWYSDKEQFEYAGAAGGWIDVLGYPFCRGRLFETIETDKGQYDDIAEIFWATGAAMFIRKDLWHGIGGLDGDYFAHQEEIDLCWRIKRAGYRIMVVPQSEVYHVGGGTLPKVNVHKTYLNFRNSFYTIIKNADKKFLFLAIVLRLVLDGIAGIRFLARGEYGNIWAVIRAHFSMYANIFKYLKKRKSYKKVIKDCSIDKYNKIGMYRGSIVWTYFVRGKKMFSKINL